MSLGNYVDTKDRMKRIKSKNDETFKEAYLELKAAANYAEENFSDTSIPSCLKAALNKYTPRFKKLNNNS